MKRLLNRYIHSNTLIQYLIFGIICRIVYLFERDILHKQVELIKIDLKGDERGKNQLVKVRTVEYLNKRFKGNIKNFDIVLFSINHSNYCYADDIIFWYREMNLKCSFFFIPDLDIFELFKPNDNISTKVAYDLKLFLAGQASTKSNSLSERLYYSRLLKGLNEKNLRTISFQDDLIKVFLKFYLPSLGDSLHLTKSALLGKIKQLNSKIPDTSLETRIVSNSVEVTPNSWRNVIITGWYGTETNGDKAILGELIHFIKSCSPHCKITITSICPWISHQTNMELGDLSNAKIVELDGADRPSLIEKNDCIIIGGGPLMESSSLLHILSLFTEADKQKKARIIFGCGIGPINTEKSGNIIAKILELTTAGFLRDEESFYYAKKLYPDHCLKWACDPAFGYIYRWRNKNKFSISEKSHFRIAGLLRANTSEFRKEWGYLKMKEANKEAAVQIARIVEPICNSTNMTFELLQMNATWIGGDDRIFNRKVEKAFENQAVVICIREYLTLEEQLKKLSTADVAIAMRYHGHIFSMGLGIPFFSIDYTGQKGKVNSLLLRTGYIEYAEKWDSLHIGKASFDLQKLITERKSLSEDLIKRTKTIVDQLYSTYFDVFGVTIKAE